MTSKLGEKGDTTNPSPYMESGKKAITTILIKSHI